MVRGENRRENAPSVSIAQNQILYFMKRIAIAVSVVFLIFAVAIQAQTPAPKPGPEHKKLEVWAGNWAFHGEAKDTPSGPTYVLDWSWQGRWLPGGFFLELQGRGKDLSGEYSYLEILGYDPIKKIYFGYVFLSNGTLEIYTSEFNDRFCLESGTDFTPDGKAIKFRRPWNFAPDFMSVSGKQENELDGAKWTAFEVKGVKTQAK